MKCHVMTAELHLFILVLIFNDHSRSKEGGGIDGQWQLRTEVQDPKRLV